MYQDNEDIFYYLTVENENYIHPKMPKNVEEGIIKGMYLYENQKISIKIVLTYLQVDL